MEKEIKKLATKAEQQEDMKDFNEEVAKKLSVGPVGTEVVKDDSDADSDADLDDEEKAEKKKERKTSEQRIIAIVHSNSENEDEEEDRDEAVYPDSLEASPKSMTLEKSIANDISNETSQPR